MYNVDNAWRNPRSDISGGILQNAENAYGDYL